MIDATTGNYRDATLSDLPSGTLVRVIAYGYGATKLHCGMTGTVVGHGRTRAIVQLDLTGQVLPMAPVVLMPIPPVTTNGAIRAALAPPQRTGQRITIGDLHLMPTSAMDLRKGDVIAFGDDVCTVLGADYAMGDGDRRADDYVSLVTESPDGSQFVDYVSPVRIFTVIRISDAVA